MVDPRGSLDTLIDPPSRLAAGTTSPRARGVADAGVPVIDLGFPSAARSERRVLVLGRELAQASR
ncbi:MAG TPA: hypothetical protein VLL75_07805 [Vicinamibacteria bacterium]|nr:hypothetical protein [Vicinamibacteria bacterium]